MPEQAPGSRMSDKPKKKRVSAKDLWLEFVNMTPTTLNGITYPRGLCGLCGNNGIIDTRGHVRSPAGWPTGIRRFCICPNGRALLKGWKSQLKEDEA